jgi:hypothetical protein
MSNEIEVISINGVDYIKKDAVKNYPTKDGLKYAIVRTYSAGVFAGYIESQNGQEVTMVKARRLWQWSGAASLSQLAMEGTSKPESCKFPCEVYRVQLMQVIEILDATSKCKKSIDSVAIWKA